MRCRCNTGLNPRVMTMVLDKAETRLLNDTVQVYARNEMFFRLQQPPMTEEYRQAAHLCYAGQDHLIERFIGDIPGVLATGTRPRRASHGPPPLTSTWLSVHDSARAGPGPPR